MNNVLYREQRKVCGDYMFIDVYPVFPCGTEKTKSGKRRAKYKPTSEIKKRLNDRKSEERALEIIHKNFTTKDYVIHLTYRDGEEPETDEAASKDEKNFLRRLSYMYKKNNQELKYFAVGARGEENGRKHFHIIINSGIGRDAVEECWNKGYCNVDRLMFDECGICALGKYMLNQIKINTRRWRASRNLEKPDLLRKRDHVYRRQDVIEAIESPYSDLLIQLYPGYTLSKEPEYIDNSMNGGIYMRLMLYRDDATFMQIRKGRGEYKKNRKSENAQHQLGFLSALLKGGEEW